MKYEDLNRLWQEQRRKDIEWQRRLLETPVALRDALFASLAPPHPSWQDFNTKHAERYVEVVNFYGIEKPVRGDINGLPITRDGILIFAIGITFDHGLDSYPKSDVYVPLASKYVGGSPLYCHFSKDNDAPDGNWTMGAGPFASGLTRRYKDYLSHDPNQGFENRVKFGFV